MKKIRTYIRISVCLGLILILSGCGIGQATVKIKPISEKANWVEANEKTVVIENENFALSISTEDTHFTILDKKGQTVYSSVPKIPSDKAEEYLSVTSELILTYYNEEGTVNDLYSGKNSVDFGSFVVFKDNNNGIMVKYTLRLTKDEILAPEVFTEESFEKLLNNMDSSYSGKMKLYYKKISPEIKTKTYYDYLEKYKYLEDGALYILKSNANELDKQAVSQYVVDAGYTLENYTADLEKIGLGIGEMDIPLSFVIPIEYRLTDNGFKASVRTDLIEITNKSYKLNTVSLLPWFSTENQNGGIAIIPDGSGAIVDFAVHDDAMFTGRFYGMDASKDTELSPQIIQNAVMNTFAADFGLGGFIATVDSATAAASYNIRRKGASSYQNTAFSSFEIYDSDETPIRREKTLILVSDKAVSEIPSVEYTLLPKVTFNVYKTFYSNYLLKNGFISQKQPDKTDVFLDFTGYTSVPSSFLGVPYDKKVVLSTVSGIKNYVEQLYALGIENISVRLSDFGNGGTQTSLQNSFSIYSKVGSVEELTDLAKLIGNHGGTLYLENNPTVVYKNGLFDDFSVFSNTVRQIDNTFATKYNMNIVTGEIDKNLNTGYYVSPIYYQTCVEDYIDSLNKKTDSSLFGISFSSAGNTLISDFSKKNYLDRSRSRMYIEQTLKTIKEKNFKLIVDVGNVYSIKNAEMVLNIPLNSSSVNIQKHSIPLFEAAIQKHIKFAGAPINISSDPDFEFLKALSSGASLHYSFITEDTAVTEIKAGQTMLPTAANDYLTNLTEQYRIYSDIINLVDNSEIEDYMQISENRFKTVYSNKSYIVCDYSSKGIIDSAISVGPYSFICGKEGE